MKKAIIILPFTPDVTKSEIKQLKEVVMNSPDHIIFSIPVNINNLLFNKLKKIQLQCIGKIIILPLFKEINVTQMSIHAHQIFLREKDVYYFANYTFRDLRNINMIYNKIDTISKNDKISAVFFEKNRVTEKQYLKKIIHKILNVNLFDIVLSKRVITKKTANYIYNDCNQKNLYLFTMYFIAKLYSLIGRKNLKLSIY